MSTPATIAYDNAEFFKVMGRSFERAFERIEREDAHARAVLNGLARASRRGKGRVAWAAAVALLWSRAQNGGKLFGFFPSRDRCDLYLEAEQ